MSFGRKGMAAGQAAPAPGGGFGNAKQVAQAVSTGEVAVVHSAEQDDIAAKRAAFIASERARSAQAGGVSTRSDNADPLINLRNMSRPTRPAQPLDSGPMGESGIPESQEEEIRAMARGMARGTKLPDPSSGSGRPSKSSSGGFIFGDPQNRNVGMAYVLWFVLGQFSLHRFYCGQKDTAIIQVALWVGSLVILFIFPPIGLIGLGLWLCWLVGDLFMIPGMLKKFKAEHDYRAVFA